MKIISKTLLVGALSLTLVACGTTEEEEASQTGGQDQQDTEETAEEDVNTEAEADEEDTTEDSEDTLPVTILDAPEGEFKLEVDGTELTFDASTYTTDFNKEIIQLDGMSFEYREEGQPAVSATFEDGHMMSQLSFVVEENLIYDGNDVATREINVDREIHLETSLLGNAGHVNEYSVHKMDESSSFDFYIKIEGDASKPGNFPDVIRGQEYRQYTFVDVTENGRYYVKLQFPADVMEEFEATAIAMALTYNAPESADLEVEESDEEAEEVEADEE